MEKNCDFFSFFKKATDSAGGDAHSNERVFAEFIYYGGDISQEITSFQQLPTSSVVRSADGLLKTVFISWEESSPSDKEV